MHYGHHCGSVDSLWNYNSRANCYSNNNTSFHFGFAYHHGTTIHALNHNNSDIHNSK